MNRFCAAVIGAVMASVLVAPQAGAATTVEVVALGDSTASGTGAGDYLAGTGAPGGCWRSANAYPQVLAEKLRTNGRTVQLTDVACGGAAIADLGKPFRGQPPQLDSLKKSTNVVTVTVGGNDISLAEFGGTCIQADCTGAPAQALLERLPALAGDLTTLLGEIKARSPRATIVLVGYGRQLTPGENAAGPLDPICGDGVLTLAERREGARIAAALDATLLFSSVLARISGGRTVYVSPFAAPGKLRPQFAGHSLCESQPAYYRGFDALAPGQEGPEAVFHLNRTGHSVLAGLIADKLRK